MTLPDRPVDGAEVAIDWGQQVHDRVFAPKGTSVHGDSLAVAVGPPDTRALYLNHADDDPGGWIDPDNTLQLVVPDEAEGLYVLMVQVDAVGGSSSDAVRLFLKLNGTDIASAKEDSEGGLHIKLTMTVVGALSAGDQLVVRAQKLGSGANPTFTVEHFNAIRIGAELGA